MESAPSVGWLGRKFGWSGSRQEWINLGLILLWVAGVVLIGIQSPRLSIGQSLFLSLLWLAVLMVGARDHIKRLFGPVFFYDMVRTGRQKRTFGLRLTYTIGLGLLLATMYYDWHHELTRRQGANVVIGIQEMSKMAHEFFQTYVLFQYTVVVLLTPVYVAGAIAVEKERKTLEFLFATDLRNSEIVFGKVASRVATLLLYVCAGLPVVAIIQLFGGVDPNELLAAFIVTVVSVLAISIVGIWMSTQMKRSRDAIGLTYITFLIYIAGSFLLAIFSIIPMAGAWWQYTIPIFGYNFAMSDISTLIAKGNPLWGLALTTPGAPISITVPELVRDFVLFWGLVGTGLLLHAILRLRAIALDHGKEQRADRAAKKQAKALAKREAKAGKTATVESPNGITGAEPNSTESADTNDQASRPRSKKSRGLREHVPVGDSPVLWKEVFVDGYVRSNWIWRIVQILITMIAFSVPLIMTYMYLFYTTSFPSSQMFTRELNVWIRVFTGILGTLMFFSAAITASGAISTEKDRDTWISLISTPLTADSILWGKFWGSMFAQRPMIYLLCVFWSYGLFWGAIDPKSIPLLFVTTVVLLSAFIWIGLYCSLIARNGIDANIRAVGYSVFFTGGFWAVIMVLISAISYFDVERDDYSYLLQLSGAATPSFLYGWLPVRYFTDQEMSPFLTHNFQQKTYSGPGLLAIPFGWLLWSLFNVFGWWVCRYKLSRLSNRVPALLPGERQLRAEFEARRQKETAERTATPVLESALNPPVTDLQT